jgi:hypothetical protein
MDTGPSENSKTPLVSTTSVSLSLNLFISFPPARITCDEVVDTGKSKIRAIQRKLLKNIQL